MLRNELPNKMHVQKRIKNKNDIVHAFLATCVKNIGDLKIIVFVRF